MTPRRHVVDARSVFRFLAGVALCAVTAAATFALTPMGIAGDTQCRAYVVELADSGAVCREAVATRTPWVVVAAAVAFAAAVGGVLAARRGARESSRVTRRALLAAALLAALALTAAGAFRLGFGSSPYCRSAITGAGSYPYDEQKPALCADTYARDRAFSWTELGGAVVVLAMAVGLSRRRDRAATAPRRAAV